MFQAKAEEVKGWFSSYGRNEEIYQKIIDLGRSKPKMLTEHKIPPNLVTGCQSTMHLYSVWKAGLIYYEAESDALISSGLGVLLTYVYSGENSETIINKPPHYLEELGIPHILSPSRANGLYNIHLRMKQEAVKLLVENTSTFI